MSSASYLCSSNHGKFIVVGANADARLSSYAITDATVPKDDQDLKSIWLRPFFFDKGTDTKNNLPKTDDADALKKWCDQKDYILFPTAGMQLKPNEISV